MATIGDAKFGLTGIDKRIFAKLLKMAAVVMHALSSRTLSTVQDHTIELSRLIDQADVENKVDELWFGKSARVQIVIF